MDELKKLNEDLINDPFLKKYKKAVKAKIKNASKSDLYLLDTIDILASKISQLKDFLIILLNERNPDTCLEEPTIQNLTKAIENYEAFYSCYLSYLKNKENYPDNEQSPVTDQASDTNTDGVNLAEFKQTAYKNMAKAYWQQFISIIATHLLDWMEIENDVIF